MKWMCCLGLLVTCAFASADAQTRGAVQVPLETATGWGPITPPDGYKALRIQGRSTADPFLLAQLFADFSSHPSKFPRVVAGVDILACDAFSLKMRYRTIFDSRPGGKTTVESFSSVNASVHDERVEFTWRSDTVKSAFVNAAAGRAMFVARPTPNGTETLIDYVSAIRPKNAVKGVLVESQRSVLANDARYVIDRLIAAAEQHTGDATARPATANIFGCKAKQ